jgi:hypothetical protein
MAGFRQTHRLICRSMVPDELHGFVSVDGILHGNERICHKGLLTLRKACGFNFCSDEDKIERVAGASNLARTSLT